MASTPHRHTAQWSDELDQLDREGQVSSAMISDVIDWLVTTSTRPIETVIDIGAGPGHAAVAFATALPAARVVAFDPTRELLDRARQRALEAGVAARLDAVQGEVDSGLEELPAADLIWCSHVLHHLPDPVEGLRTVSARLHTGGRVAVREGGLPTRVLPGGYGVGSAGFAPRLEALMADHMQHAWDMTHAASGGDRDWPVLMAQAGLADIATRAFLVHATAPIDDVTRAHVVTYYNRARDAVGADLTAEDARALDILLDENDERSLARRPDVFLLSASTVHVGTLGQRGGEAGGRD
jgi:SAM-dependent methyltransferase